MYIDRRPQPTAVNRLPKTSKKNQNQKNKIKGQRKERKWYRKHHSSLHAGPVPATRPTTHSPEEKKEYPQSTEKRERKT
jgi:hypothetical protein